jgi:hypothetical protein
MSHDAPSGTASGGRSTETMSGSTTPADSRDMAAASLLVRSGTSFSVEPFAIGTGLSVVCGFSIAGAFSFDETFSLEGFAVVVTFSGEGFVVVEDFSAVAFATVGAFSVAVDFGFVATFPFEAELALGGAGVFAEVIAFVEAFSVRDFSVETDLAAESLAAVVAVSGRTPRAHALAMTTNAISGIRARPVISSLVEGYTEKATFRSGLSYASSAPPLPRVVG